MVIDPLGDGSLWFDFDVLCVLDASNRRES